MDGINWFVFYKAIIAAYCKKYIKRINTLCGQSANNLNAIASDMHK